ncbi:Response regulator receiver domain-containing protein [Litoreibacter janthinus]|uniref:Response regulator receiver domain-containing protein n=1 Tax=Litoreibacter janthinus TaxID=670154 RepID=A0A1I6FRW8_9RHOB|nr:Response regulator receiver domain-containing protein [Litoreibacter janthinus]
MSLATKIIIFEDEPLIAFDIEEAVLEAGCEVVGIARTVEEGLGLLKTVACDGAVLDANLNGNSVEPIAKELEARKLRYIIASGYSRDQLEFVHDATPLVNKPFSMPELVSVVRTHLCNEEHEGDQLA